PPLSPAWWPQLPSSTTIPGGGRPCSPPSSGWPARCRPTSWSSPSGEGSGIYFRPSRHELHHFIDRLSPAVRRSLPPDRGRGCGAAPVGGRGAGAQRGRRLGARPGRRRALGARVDRRAQRRVRLRPGDAGARRADLRRRARRGRHAGSGGGEKAVSFSRIVATTWRENLLFAVLVELTYRCNLDCFFCYNDLGLRGEPMSREEYFRFFADLREMEVMNLSLSGGEPLAHPDFLALGARARELGFVVRVKSNGHALRGELARRVRDEVDPFLIEVSLHGATAATHDRQTRVPGSFDRLLANLAELRELGLRVKINSTLTAWNEGEIAGMFALADSLGLPLQIDPEVTPRDDGGREPLQVAASREGVLRLFRLQFERGRSIAGMAGAPAEVARGGDDGTMPAPLHKHCGAGSSGIAVDPYGNVYPCVQWRRP